MLSIFHITNAISIIATPGCFLALAAWRLARGSGQTCESQPPHPVQYFIGLQRVSLPQCRPKFVFHYVHFPKYRAKCDYGIGRLVKQRVFGNAVIDLIRQLASMTTKHQSKSGQPRRRQRLQRFQGQRGWRHGEIFRGQS